MDRILGAIAMKRVLMIAFHFPPLNISSGIQRTLRFAQHLPDFGWQPIVLTADARAYTATSDAALSDVPKGLLVRRAFALDAGRHLAVRGRYPLMMAIPDRWWTWWLGAVPAGLGLIRKFRPDVLWTTYPIATAHLIGYTLHRLTGIPWVVDFRDPMAQDDYPPTPLEHRAYEWIERRALQHCRRAVFAAPSALSLYRERYPGVSSSHFAVIENGYDEAAFAAAEHKRSTPDASDPLRLVHSGTVYPYERDPTPLFVALSALKKSGAITGQGVQIVFRASGCDSHMRTLMARYDVEDIVALAEPLSYTAALAEMVSSDGLLLLQAANCNHQVPAKLYEYLRARRPVLALTERSGDTAAILLRAGIDTLAPLDSAQEIGRLLVRFLDLVRRGQAPVAGADSIAPASRKARTSALADVLRAAQSPCTAGDGWLARGAPSTKE